MRRFAVPLSFAERDGPGSHAEQIDEMEQRYRPREGKSAAAQLSNGERAGYAVIA
jgi:hypothetical protein